MSNINEIKDKKQQEFAQTLLTSLAITTRVSGIIATGVGKSRITMLVLEQLYQQFDTIYIVVNSTKLKDFSWKEDFIKWGKQYIWEKVVMVTYQTGYKWEVTELDLSKSFIVYDEIDFAIGTPEYSKMIYTFKDVRSLGLTGYVANSKRDELHKLLPIVIEYDFDQAVEDKVVNDVEFVFVKYDLDTTKNIKVEWVDKVTKQRKFFLQSENDAYEYVNKRFISTQIKLDELEKGLLDGTGMVTEADLVKAKKAKEAASNFRAAMLYKNNSVVKYVLKVKEHLLNLNSTNKVITFSKYTSQADKLSKFTYHGGTTTDKKQSELNYDNFNEGIIRELAVCGKLYRGVNIEGLNNILMESYNSSDTVISQVRGRGARLKVTDTCTFYIFMPYWAKKIKVKEETLVNDVMEEKLVEKLVQTKTQAVIWCENMLKEIDTTNVKIWDQRSIKGDL